MPNSAGAAGVVPARHEGEAKGRARCVDDGAIAKRSDSEAKVIERDRASPDDPEHIRRRDAAKPGMSVEQRVVLLRQIEERGSGRKRDHDRIDASGPHRDRAEQRRRDAADQDR